MGNQLALISFFTLPSGIRFHLHPSVRLVCGGHVFQHGGQEGLKFIQHLREVVFLGQRIHQRAAKPNLAFKLGLNDVA